MSFEAADHTRQACDVASFKVLVPDVTGQAFVFAKGSLEDAGFAWHVTGPIHGYAVNRVVSQSPAAGTKLARTRRPNTTRMSQFQ